MDRYDRSHGIKLGDSSRDGLQLKISLKKASSLNEEQQLQLLACQANRLDLPSWEVDCLLNICREKSCALKGLTILFEYASYLDKILLLAKIICTSSSSIVSAESRGYPIFCEVVKFSRGVSQLVYIMCCLRRLQSVPRLLLISKDFLSVEGKIDKGSSDYLEISVIIHQECKCVLSTLLNHNIPSMKPFAEIFIMLASNFPDMVVSFDNYIPNISEMRDSLSIRSLFLSWFEMEKKISEYWTCTATTSLESEPESQHSPSIFRLPYDESSPNSSFQPLELSWFPNSTSEYKEIGNTFKILSRNWKALLQDECFVTTEFSKDIAIDAAANRNIDSLIRVLPLGQEMCSESSDMQRGNTLDQTPLKLISDPHSSEKDFVAGSKMSEMIRDKPDNNTYLSVITPLEDVSAPTVEVIVNNERPTVDNLKEVAIASRDENGKSGPISASYNNSEELIDNSRVDSSIVSPSKIVGNSPPRIRAHTVHTDSSKRSPLSSSTNSASKTRKESASFIVCNTDSKVVDVSDEKIDVENNSDDDYINDAYCEDEENEEIEWKESDNSQDNEDIKNRIDNSKSLNAPSVKPTKAIRVKSKDFEDDEDNIESTRKDRMVTRTKQVRGVYSSPNASKKRISGQKRQGLKKNGTNSKSDESRDVELEDSSNLRENLASDSTVNIDNKSKNGRLRSGSVKSNKITTKDRSNSNSAEAFSNSNASPDASRLKIVSPISHPYPVDNEPSYVWDGAESPLQHPPNLHRPTLGSEASFQEVLSQAFVDLNHRQSRIDGEVSMEAFRSWKKPLSVLDLAQRKLSLWWRLIGPQRRLMRRMASRRFVLEIVEDLIDRSLVRSWQRKKRQTRLLKEGAATKMQRLFRSWRVAIFEEEVKFERESRREIAWYLLDRWATAVLSAIKIFRYMKYRRQHWQQYLQLLENPVSKSGQTSSPEASLTSRLSSSSTLIFPVANSTKSTNVLSKTSSNSGLNVAVNGNSITPSTTTLLNSSNSTSFKGLRRSQSNVRKLRLRSIMDLYFLQLGTFQVLGDPKLRALRANMDERKRRSSSFFALSGPSISSSSREASKLASQARAHSFWLRKVNSAVLRIQCFIRSFLARCRYRARKNEKFIQTRLIAFMNRRHIRKRVKRRKIENDSAVLIQRMMRGFHIRRLLFRRIQSTFRVYSLWKRYRAIHNLRQRLRRIERPYTLVLKNLFNVPARMVHSNTISINISAWWHPLLHIVGEKDIATILESRQPQFIYRSPAFVVQNDRIVETGNKAKYKTTTTKKKDVGLKVIDEREESSEDRVVSSEDREDNDSESIMTPISSPPVQHHKQLSSISPNQELHQSIPSSSLPDTCSSQSSSARPRADSSNSWSSDNDQEEDDSDSDSEDSDTSENPTADQSSFIKSPSTFFFKKNVEDRSDIDKDKNSTGETDNAESNTSNRNRVLSKDLDADGKKNRKRNSKLRSRFAGLRKVSRIMAMGLGLSGHRGANQGALGRLFSGFTLKKPRKTPHFVALEKLSCDLSSLTINIPGCHGNSVIKFEIFDGEYVKFSCL